MNKQQPLLHWWLTIVISTFVGFCYFLWQHPISTELLSLSVMACRLTWEMRQDSPMRNNCWICKVCTARGYAWLRTNHLMCPFVVQSSGSRTALLCKRVLSNRNMMRTQQRSRTTRTCRRLADCTESEWQGPVAVSVSGKQECLCVGLKCREDDRKVALPHCWRRLESSTTPRSLIMQLLANSCIKSEVNVFTHGILPALKCSTETFGTRL